MLSKQFWRATGERAAKTFLQVLAAALTPALFVSMDWRGAAGAVLLAVQAAVFSVLTSMASTFTGDPDSPSLVQPRPDGQHSRPPHFG